MHPDVIGYLEQLANPTIKLIDKKRLIPPKCVVTTGLLVLLYATRAFDGDFVDTVIAMDTHPWLPHDPFLDPEQNTIARDNAVKALRRRIKEGTLHKVTSMNGTGTDTDRKLITSNGSDYAAVKLCMERKLRDNYVSMPKKKGKKRKQPGKWRIVFIPCTSPVLPTKPRTMKQSQAAITAPIRRAHIGALAEYAADDDAMNSSFASEADNSSLMPLLSPEQTADLTQHPRGAWRSHVGAGNASSPRMEQASAEVRTVAASGGVGSSSAAAAHVFRVGQQVVVAGRDGASFDAENNTDYAGTVHELLDGGGYSVRHTLTRRLRRVGDGKRLRANTLLEPRNPMQSLLSPESERRSVHDAAASNQRAAFEKARADRVQGELDESRMELDESRVKLKQQEEKIKLEREQRMAAQRAAAGAAAAAEKSENLRVAETAKINAAALEMMEGAVEDATAQLKKELLKVRQVLQKVEEAQGGQMREQAARHSAEMARVLATLASSVADTKEAMKDEHDAEVELMRAALQQEHDIERRASELRIEEEKSAREELEKRLGDNSILAVGRLLLPKETYDTLSKIPGMNNMGKTKAKVKDMCQKQQRDLGRFVSAVVEAILQKAKAGESDAAGVLDAVLARRDSKSTEVGRVLLAKIEEKEAAERAGTLEVLALAYRTHRKKNEKQTAAQILSVAVGVAGVSDNEIKRTFSSARRPFKVRDAVFFVGSRNKTLKGQVTAVGSGTVTISGVAQPVQEERVWHEGDVRCTQRQVAKAKAHAAQFSPGAQVPKQVNGHVGISAERAAKVASFLRDKSVVEPVEGSFQNASTGVRWRLKQRRWVLWHRLVKQMQEEGMKPVSWGYFSLLTGTRQYELLTADNCCCGICRELGFDNYDEMRDIAKQLDAELLLLTNDATGLPTLASLLERIKHEEGFRRGPFLTHLKEQDSCGHHCLRHLLSTANDSRFHAPCTHEPPTSGAGPMPQTMDDVVAADTSNRKKTATRGGKDSDWHDTCEVCQKDTVGGKKKNLTLCSHCCVVAHKPCIQKWMWDYPQELETEWTCPDCQREIDSVLHSASCGECCEADRIIETFKAGLSLLAKLEASPQPSSSSSSSSSSALPEGVKTALASEVLTARLQAAEGKQQKYHAHLTRDRNQGCFKQLILDDLPLGSYYLLVDYWAKINVAKKGGTAVCEGDSKGLSAHGSMFVYKNPSGEERKGISRRYNTVIDWAKFGPPQERGGLAFLEEHYDVYSDDAKQNNYHTKSVLDATIASFLQQRPWLAGNRSSYMQSDNASNYRDPTTEVDLLSVGTRCFSEAGMGKDEGDGNGAVIKGKIRRVRDESNGIEHAEDLLQIGHNMGISGQTHAVLNIDRSREDGGCDGRGSVCRTYSLWTIDETHITFWESLDVEASRTSMKEGGRAVGFGPGVKMALAEYGAKQRTQLKSTGATLRHADGGSSSAPNPKQRASKNEKKRQKEKKEGEREAKTAAAAEEQEKRDEEEALFCNNETDECPRCHQQFLSKGWFNRHRDRWCRDRSAWRASRRAERDVAARLVVADELLLQQNKDRVADLGVVRVKLTAPRLEAAGVGIDLEDTPNPGGGYTVSGVSGLAEASAQIAEGFVAIAYSCGDTTPTTTTTTIDSAHPLPETLRAGESITVTVLYPPASIPYHGSSRYSAHKRVTFKMHPEQVRWLEEHAFKGGLQLMRPVTAHLAMKAQYKQQIRTDTMTPLWLDKDQIATWMAGRNKDEKQRRRDERKRQMTERKAGSDGAPKKKKQRTAAVSTPAARGNSKGKSKAAAKPNSKRKAAELSEESEEEEDSDEYMESSSSSSDSDADDDEDEGDE